MHKILNKGLKRWK